ncbi:MAG TPA: 2-amino-4-hydroxy-6-hydroxymethyldihydropteridine diphosphokinase [Thermoanaerobaculia bacterium]|nr:2-amino-4-hydroxy-6-hydroxymethyldihydropteridine diphosphokinase [Thermoanaerobaculia bacterium]
MTPVTVALALGGNEGAVEQTLRLALRQLRASLGPLVAAPLYRSRAVSPIPQPDYLNTAALARTALPPEAVLALAKALERAAGRRRGPRFGPRPLDIDLLLYDGLLSDSAEMTLPHPRLRERRFVLEPLAEIAPDLPVPPDGAPVRELLARVAPEPLERVLGRGWDLL